VLRLLARGRSQREIADALVISQSTAHTHIVHIYEKCEVSTRASVALFAMENDLLSA
jgi:DNA-binding NarL/FixJ family response regulator